MSKESTEREDLIRHDTLDLKTPLGKLQDANGPVDQLRSWHNGRTPTSQHKLSEREVSRGSAS
eukprot:15458707-Alexandrium_andersonii.AAC.1